MSTIFHAILPGRDELHLSVSSNGGTLTAIGCPEVLKLCVEWRPKLNGPVSTWPMPEGDSHSEILLREVILRARGEWELPYKEEELCHCRVVPTAKVDAAIVGGAHTAAAVSARTSAGTSCGTCQPDIQKMLGYRLKCRAS